MLVKKNLIVFTIALSIFFGGLTAFAEVIRLTPDEKNELKLNSKENEYNKNLVIKDRDVIEDLIKIQKEEEVKDIELLWQATIDNNALIKFTMNKLNTPESQRRLHSSLMAKSLSSLIYGASFIPMFTGSNAMMQSAAFSAGRLANNFINKEASTSNGQQVPITDTELIQLAGTIEDLQEKIISSYYQYKGSLNKLKDTRSRMLLYSRNYEKALETDDILDIAISSSLYDNLKIQEYKEEQLARKYHSTLQRLAGKTAVDKLSIYQYDFNATLVKGNIK